MKKLIECFVLMFFFFFSKEVYASDFSGVFAVIFLVYFVGLFSLVNIIIVSIFLIKEKYKFKRFAAVHAALGSSVPLIGCLISLIDYSTMYDLLNLLFWNLLALILSLSPLLIHKLQKN